MKDFLKNVLDKEKKLKEKKKNVNIRKNFSFLPLFKSRKIFVPSVSKIFSKES
jgi:hypothetical protein